MRYISNVLLLAVLLVSVANGAKPVHVIPDGSKVFIAPMEGNLHGFIAAEVIKQKLPFIVTTDDKEADFVLTGMSVQGDNKWFNSVWGGKDKNEGNVQLVNAKTKQVIWAGEAGDRTMFYGGFHRGGLRKVADRIVTSMKKELFR